MGILLMQGCSESNWHNASRESAGLAPDPTETPEPVLQVYGADAWEWRGFFAIHTWIAAKRSGEISYTVYDVVGWRARDGYPVLRIRKDIPDRYWFGAKPSIIKEYSGPGVDKLIAEGDKKLLFKPPLTLPPISSRKYLLSTNLSSFNRHFTQFSITKVLFFKSP